MYALLLLPSLVFFLLPVVATIIRDARRRGNENSPANRSDEDDEDSENDENDEDDAYDEDKEEDEDDYGGGTSNIVILIPLNRKSSERANRNGRHV